jgi:hypothetical protein
MCPKKMNDENEKFNRRQSDDDIEYSYFDSDDFDDDIDDDDYLPSIDW